MLVQTRRYGPLETIDVPASQLYEFYPGLGGFQEHHSYAVLTEQDSPVEWLQATGDADVCFALLDPFLFQPDYTFEMADPDASALGLAQPEEAIVRVILTLRESASEITANLMAPVVLNPGMRLGRQLVLQDSDWPLRAPVLDTLQQSAAPAARSEYDQAEDETDLPRSAHAA